MNLRTIITADLVHREDIKELQNGIRHLLKTRRTNRFFNFHTDGLDEICNRLEKMDSTLLSWYEKVDCGIFEFKGHRLESTIDCFTVSICNIDSAYLLLEFSLYLTDEKKNELGKLIKCNYHEDRGYATSTLTARKNRIGSFQNYSVIHYILPTLLNNLICNSIFYVMQSPPSHQSCWSGGLCCSHTIILHLCPLYGNCFKRAY